MSTQKTSPDSDKLKGSVKEAIGKLIGDGKVGTEGRDQRKSSKSDVSPKTTPNS
jgi:uncharacterized protein YjbJ (UPF0337 family)